MDNIRSVIKLLFRYTSAEEVISGNTHYNHVKKQSFHVLANAYMSQYSNNEIENMFQFLKSEFLWHNNKIRGEECSEKTRKVTVFDALLLFTDNVLVEENEKPLCRYEHLLRWRDIIIHFDEDMFITAFLAQKDLLENNHKRNFFWAPKANPDLSLYDCIALDMVQKHETIDKDIAARLRKLHLVEGRYPKLFLSAYTAKTVDNKELKTEYIRNKSFNDLHFKDMIVQYLRSFGGATRSELNTLLQTKLSDVLTEEQKIRKIGNMLSALKKDGVIRLSEKKKWILVEV